MLNFSSPELTLKMVHEQTQRSSQQAYWLHQLADYAPSTDTVSEEAAVVASRRLIMRLIERISGSERADETNS